MNILRPCVFCCVNYRSDCATTVLITAENIFKAQVVRSCKIGLIAMVATPQMVVDVLTQMMLQQQSMLDQMANMQVQNAIMLDSLSRIEALSADTSQPASGPSQPASSSLSAASSSVLPKAPSSGHLQQPLDQLLDGSSQPASTSLAASKASTPSSDEAKADEESDDGVDLSDPYWRDWLAPESVFSKKKGEVYCNLCRKFDGASHRSSERHCNYLKLWTKYHKRLAAEVPARGYQ